MASGRPLPNEHRGSVGNDHSHGHSHGNENGNGKGNGNGPSWALNGSPFDDDQEASQAFDNGFEFEETDHFNPNGLGHNGHLRTHSFSGTRSPVKANFKPPIKTSIKSHIRQGSGYALSPISAAFPDHVLQAQPQPQSHDQDHDHDHDHDHQGHNGHSHSHSHSSHSHSHSNHSHSHSHSNHSQGHSHSHTHSHSHSQASGGVGLPTATNASSSSWFSLPEALTGLLIPLPYLLASAAYSTPSPDFPPLSAYARLQQSVPEGQDMADHSTAHHASSFLQACTLTSGTLLLIAILANIRASERVLDRRKTSNPSLKHHALFTPQSLVKMVTSTLKVGLPYYAAVQIGGMRVGLVLLSAIASGLTCSDKLSHSFIGPLSSRPATFAAISLSVLADVFGLTIYADVYHLITGYMALALSVTLLQPPLPSNGSSSSSLIASPSDISATMFAGVALSVITIASSVMFSLAPSVSPASIAFSTFSMAIVAGLVLLARPSHLATQKKAGLAFGCLLAAASSVLFSPSTWPGTFFNGALAALSYVAVLYDTSSHSHSPSHSHSHDEQTHAHAHDHHHVLAPAQAHAHCHHHHAHAETSIFTSFVLARCQSGSLLHTILCERDSRRIAYFTCLNFGFMLVQAFYGWVSGSLGLLSDTVHMFFDCLALIIGLGAAVASKWPTSPEMPFGWGKLNVLAGFGNGIFLMLVSVEFVWEAVEGIMEGTELRHVEELLVVSTLGFVVNMVGLLAFGHAHHGHDHDHDHGHGNENMHGIYLHIAADAGGSLAVIISTLMTLWKPWYLWDPLATIVIAVLIFLAAVPLVRDSGNKLLLVIPNELEYGLKNALQELSGLRGVTGYAVPRFWVEDEAPDAHDHAHDHGHDHDHAHEEPKRKKINGVIHVFASRAADLEDVRERVVDYFNTINMDVVVQVEREGEGRCWCGGGVKMG